MVAELAKAAKTQRELDIANERLRDAHKRAARLEEGQK